MAISRFKSSSLLLKIPSRHRRLRDRPQIVCPRCRSETTRSRCPLMAGPQAIHDAAFVK